MTDAPRTAWPRTVSLLDPGMTADLLPIVRERLPEWAANERTHLVLAASADDVSVVLRGSSKLGVLAGESAWVAGKSQLRSLSVSGFPDEACGKGLLARFLTEPVQLRAELPSLHLHLADLRFSSNGSKDEQAPPNEAEAASAAYTLRTARVKLADVELPEEVLRRIRRSLLVIRRRDLLVDWGVAAVPGFRDRLGSSLNFVGLPGTGKSLAAEAVAGELGMPLLQVDYARLESKYVGDTSKNIKEVFKVARESEAVLFFDEADSFLGRRVEDVRQSYDTAVNNTRSVMLLELGEFAGVVVFATNLVTNYDPAFRRRILDHIEFPLPDEEARTKILRRHTPELLPGRATVDFAALGSMSTGCSGGDLANAVYQVCLRVLGRWDDGENPQDATTEDFAASIEEVLHSQRMFRDRGADSRSADAESEEDGSP